MLARVYRTREQGNRVHTVPAPCHRCCSKYKDAGSGSFISLSQSYVAMHTGDSASKRLHYSLHPNHTRTQNVGMASPRFLAAIALLLASQQLVSQAAPVTQLCTMAAEVLQECRPLLGYIEMQNYCCSSFSAMLDLDCFW